MKTGQYLFALNFEKESYFRHSSGQVVETLTGTKTLGPEGSGFLFGLQGVFTEECSSLSVRARALCRGHMYNFDPLKIPGTVHNHPMHFSTHFSCMSSTLLFLD